MSDDQANLAIQNVPDAELRSLLLASEREFQNGRWPYHRIRSLRTQIKDLAIAYKKLADDSSAEIADLKTATAKLRSSLHETFQAVTGDKAAKAIDGLLLYPNPHLKIESAPTIGRDENVRELVSEENLLRSLLIRADGLAPDGRSIEQVITSIREQVRIAALAYAKAQSDLNAAGIQQANDQNFIQSMGDAFKFQTFLQEHFRNDLLNNPQLKILEVAELVISRLLNEIQR